MEIVPPFMITARFCLMTGRERGVTYLPEKAPTNHQDLLAERAELAVELPVELLVEPEAVEAAAEEEGKEDAEVPAWGQQVDHLPQAGPADTSSSDPSY